MHMCTTHPCSHIDTSVSYVPCDCGKCVCVHLAGGHLPVFHVILCAIEINWDALHYVTLQYMEYTICMIASTHTHAHTTYYIYCLCILLNMQIHEDKWWTQISEIVICLNTIPYKIFYVHTHTHAHIHARQSETNRILRSFRGKLFKGPVWKLIDCKITQITRTEPNWC